MTYEQRQREATVSAPLTRREFLYLSGAGLAGVTSAIIPGSSEGADKKPNYGGHLRIGERFASPGLDCHRNQEFMDYQNYYLMYNGLTDVGQLPQVNIYPDLAKSWQISRDGLAWTFQLRDDVLDGDAGAGAEVGVNELVDRAIGALEGAPLEPRGRAALAEIAGLLRLGREAG